MKKILSIICSMSLILSMSSVAFADELDTKLLESNDAVNEIVEEIYQLPFTDVTIDSWFYEALLDLYNKDIIKGVDEVTFAPQNTLTKGHVFLMLSRYLHMGQENVNLTFEDAWEFLVSNGIINRETYSLESINEPISRYELAHVITSYLNYNGYVVDESILAKLPYTEELNPNYKNAVYTCYVAGVLGGVDSKGTFLGNRILTRAEGVAALYRLFNPDVRNDITGYKNFNQLLATFSTEFDSSQTNRAFNVQKAGDTISGLVVKSGDEFSFNKVVGNAGRNEGYKLANIISGGKYVKGYGGGVCQTATTLYNAALRANLKITERHAHSLKSAYVDAGFDATIAYNTLDMRFVNSYESDIKIISETNDGVITFWIYGDSSINVPELELEVKKENGVYTLYRIVDDVVNFSTASKYKN